MDVPTLDEVHQQKETLKGQPFAAYRQLLRGIGTYFTRTLPSRLDNDYILEVEPLLNDLYVQAHDEGWPDELQDALRRALDKASYLCEIIQKSVDLDEPRGHGFFRVAKELGEVLEIVYRSWSSP